MHESSKVKADRRDSLRLTFIVPQQSISSRRSVLSSMFQFVGGVQRLWTTHTTKVTWSGESVARSGVQWYEIDVDSKAVVQQGVFGATGFGAVHCVFCAVRTAKVPVGALHA